MRHYDIGGTLMNQPAPFKHCPACICWGHCEKEGCLLSEKEAITETPGPIDPDAKQFGDGRSHE